MPHRCSCNDYSENSTRLFSELYKSSKFSDVTLVSDDKTYFKAHKFILSSYSSVFKSILEECTLDCIFLQGMSKYAIETILQFLYHGEVIVSDEKTLEFQNAIDKLKIKTGDQNIFDITDTSNIPKEENVSKEL